MANVRSYFTKNGGNLGETGSVAFMFDRVGEIVYPVNAGTEDAIMEAALDAGADDGSATKIELARAYLDIGDTEGARSMLEEVVAEAGPAGRAAAQRLLTEIG